MDREAKTIKSETLKLCWHMRGGLTYSDAMQLGVQERDIISDIIKEHLDTTKKTGLPYF